MESIEKTKSQRAADSYAVLVEAVKNCIEESKESKTKILNKAQYDWIDRCVIAEINERNTLWAELNKKSDDNALKEKFRKKRNQVTKLIQKRKDSYYLK